MTKAVNTATHTQGRNAGAREAGQGTQLPSISCSTRRKEEERLPPHAGAEVTCAEHWRPTGLATALPHPSRPVAETTCTRQATMGPRVKAEIY